MPDICIITLIGIPAAGKTHLCKILQQKFTSETTEIKHISFDELEKLYPSINYKDFRNEIYTKIDSLINESIKSINKTKCIILIDDNMYYQSMRRSIYNLAKKYTIGFGQIYLKCDLELAITRNSARTQIVPREVLTNIAAKLEPPSNTWELFSCTLASSDDGYNDETLKDVWEMIIKTMEHPVCTETEPEVSIQQQMPSIVHTADLLLRKCIAKNLQETEDKRNLAKLAEEFALKKKIILHKIRTSEILLTYKNDEEFQNVLYSMLEINE